MATGRHYLIKFGDVWFTRDGLETGIPCASEIEGFHVFEDDGNETGQDIKALDGTVHQQYIEIIDSPVSITLIKLEQSVLDDIRTEIGTYKSSGTPIDLILDNGPEGTARTFTFKPRAREAITYPETFYLTRRDRVTVHGYATLAP